MRVEIDGLEAVVRDMTRDALTIRPKVGAVVVAYADRSAQMMHDRVQSRRVKDAITADTDPTIDGHVLYADAGPDRRASNQAFIARFIENGTVKLAPRPFAAPTMDALAPGFARDLAGLVGD